MAVISVLPRGRLGAFTKILLRISYSTVMDVRTDGQRLPVR
jgi:hypothetical protein